MSANKEYLVGFASEISNLKTFVGKGSLLYVTEGVGLGGGAGGNVE